ncbi:MAG: hypothetical protein HZC01_01225 [Candidatus Kerfeldbacteria bacterium]|nr:hypothetical protein [Candidatus Kerfeldbacteria bacterium]
MGNLFKKNQTQLYSLLGVVILMLSFGLLWSTPVGAEWREPSIPPPQQEFPAPLTTGAENQAKAGDLLLDPSYNPNEQTSLNFDPLRALDVRGTGIHLATPSVFADKLTVDTDTLFVDALVNWLGIGTLTPAAGYRVVVDEGTVQIGDVNTPTSGSAVRAYSVDSVGIYGDAGATGQAGIYGIIDMPTGWAIRGESSANVGVRGESVSGTGIYATTQSLTAPAVAGTNTADGWAGYFNGRLGARAELIADRFVATYIQSSRIPFVQAKRIGYYSVSDGAIQGAYQPSLAFDGAYVWASNIMPDAAGNNVFKIRVSDGARIASYRVQGAAATPSAMEYDGQYLWITSTGTGDNSVLKFDPHSGQTIARCVTSDSSRPNGATWGDNPARMTIATEAGEPYIWTANWLGGDVSKVDRNCQVIGTYPIGTHGTGTNLNRLNSDGFFMKPADITFGDNAIWVITPALCGSTAPTTFDSCRVDASCVSGSCRLNPNNLIKIDPATGAVTARYATGVANPWKMYFDGIYMWVISNSSVAGPKSISKVRVSDGMIMAGYPKELASYRVAMEFDGQYLWLAGTQGGINKASLLRISVATDEMKEFGEVLSTNYWDSSLVFDGANLWSLSACDANCNAGGTRPLKLTKVFITGTTDHPDLSTVVQFAHTTGTCSITTTRQCLYDWHCPTAETCSVINQTQAGHMRISGSLTLKNGYCKAGGAVYYNRPCTNNGACSDLAGGACASGDLRIGADIETVGNTWSSLTASVPVTGGIADCPDGQFVASVTLDSNSKISQITCRGL